MLPTGWLSPEGKFHECEYMDHMAVAEDLCEEYGYEDDNYIKDEVLLDHGWAHLTITTFFSHNWMIMWKDDYMNHLTQDQKAYLKPYIEEYKDWLDHSTKLVLEKEYDGEVDLG